MSEMMHRLLGNSLIYAIGNAANSAALLLIIPFLIHTFTLAEYGAWSISEVAVFLLNLLILAGLEVGLMRQYWAQHNADERARIVGTTILTVMLVGALVVGSGTALILAGLGRDFPGAPWSLLLVLSIGWSDSLCTIFLSLFRIREQALSFVGLSLTRLVIFTLLGIALVYGGLGLIGALTARLIASVVVVGAGWIMSRRLISWQFDRIIFWQIVAYGLPLLPTNFTSFILLAADRYVLQNVRSLEEVATYTFAYKVAAVLDVLITRPFALDWAPRRFKIATLPDAGHKYAQALLMYLWAALSFGLVIVAGTPLLYTLIAPVSYWSAMGIVPIIVLAYVVYGLSYPLNVGILLRDRTADLPVIGLIATLSCIGLCLWWIPEYGALGAAWSTVVSYVIWTGLITADSLRLYPIRYPLHLIGIIVGAAAISYSGMWLAEQWWPANSVLAALGRLLWVLGVMGISGMVLLRSSRRQSIAQPVLPV